MGGGVYSFDGATRAPPPGGMSTLSGCVTGTRGGVVRAHAATVA